MEELKKKLIDVCNASELPLEAIYFVTKDLWRDVEETLRAYEKKKALTQTEVKEDIKEEN